MANYKEIPTVPPAHPILKNGVAFSKSPLNFIEQNHAQYKDTYRIDFGLSDLLMIHNPDDVMHVLQKNHRNYTKSKGYKKLKRSLGNGLLTSHGEFWKKHRRIAQPAFYKESLQNLSQVILSESEQMVERWKELADNGKEIALLDETMRITCDIVSKSLFSANVTHELDEIRENVKTLLDLAMPLMTNPLVMPKWIPTKLNKDLAGATAYIDKVMYRIIEDRRKEKEAIHKDLLDLLMHTKDEETGHQMTNIELRDEAVILFLAGHETSANALAFAVYMIEKHPEVKSKLLEELAGAIQDDKLDLKQMFALPYTQQIIDETLRLFPPAWVIGRKAIEEDELSDLNIKAGQNLLISVYSVHRDPRYWENADEFDPSRFEKEKKRAYHNYQYLPFGGGPRMCIGNNFAYLEMKILLALMYQNFDFEILTKDLKLNPRLTLRPEDGIRMKLRNKK